MAFLMISKSCSNSLLKQPFCIFCRTLSLIVICCFSYKSCFVFKRLRIINTQISIISRDFISFKLPSTSSCIWIIIAVFDQIVRGHCKVNMFCSVNRYIINYCFTCRKWCTNFKRNICIIGCIYCICLSCN